jgi:hypothetical protein
MEMETETVAPKERLSDEERDGVVAAIAKDIARLEDKWTRNSRFGEGRHVTRPTLRAAFAQALRNVAGRLSG